MQYDESSTQVDRSIETELLEIAEKCEYNVAMQQERLTELANRGQEMTLFRRLFVAIFPHLEEERRVRG